MIPKYKVGRCLRCDQFIWVDEDCYASIMARLREISNKEYSHYALGGFLTIPITEAEKCNSKDTHLIRMIGTEKPNKTVSYINEINLIRD